MTCPVCGTNHGYSRGINYYDEMERRPDLIYGLIFATNGRGTMRKVGEFGPDDDPDEFYPKVKFHLLSAVKEWHQRGWITREEILGTAGSTEDKEDL